MKRYLLVLLTGILCLSLSAQDRIDVLSLSGRFGIPKEYKGIGISGEATEWGSLNSFTFGKDIIENTKFVINLNHFYFNVQGDPVDDQGNPAFPVTMAHPLKLNGIIIRTGIQQNLGNGRILQALVAPRLMSDFKNMDANSFMFGGVLSYKKKFRDELSIGFGAMYNTELFGPYMVPILDLYWKPAVKWTIWGMIPITARIEYAATDGMTVGFNHFGLITTYALGHEDYAGDYIERQSIDLSLFLRQRIGGPIFVEAMAGRALGRKYVQYAGDQKVDFGIPLVMFGDERVVKNNLDTGFGDGLIFTLKLIVNVKIPE